MPSYSRKVEVPGRTSKELYEKISQDIDHFLSKVPLGKFEISRDPAGKKIGVKSSMVTATLHCLEGVMQLDAKLSLLASPFRSKLDEGIDHWIQKTFKA